jgi:hypothetical protein
VEDVLAVLADGVDVAAHVEPAWVASSLVSRPEIFCWVFSGRTPRSLILFVGQILVSVVNRSTSAWRSRQNSQARSGPGQSAACLILDPSVAADRVALW